MRTLCSLLLVFSLFVSEQAVAQARSFTIGGVAFAEAEIVDARSQPDISGKAAIMITFSPQGTERLAAVSRGLIDKVMPILLNGKLLAEPIVREAIDAGVAQISGDFTVAEADALALSISGKAPLPDSLDGGP